MRVRPREDRHDEGDAQGVCPPQGVVETARVVLVIGHDEQPLNTRGRGNADTTDDTDALRVRPIRDRGLKIGEEGCLIVDEGHGRRGCVVRGQGSGDPDPGGARLEGGQARDELDLRGADAAGSQHARLGTRAIHDGGLDADGAGAAVHRDVICGQTCAEIIECVRESRRTHVAKDVGAGRCHPVGCTGRIEIVHRADDGAGDRMGGDPQGHRVLTPRDVIPRAR